MQKFCHKLLNAQVLQSLLLGRYTFSSPFTGQVHFQFPIYWVGTLLLPHLLGRNTFSSPFTGWVYFQFPIYWVGTLLVPHLLGRNTFSSPFTGQVHFQFPIQASRFDDYHPLRNISENCPKVYEQLLSEHIQMDFLSTKFNI